MARLVVNTALVLVDSITEVLAADTGRIIVSGSHGGISAATFAARCSDLVYFFNDAGIGKQQAGIAGLDHLQQANLPACCVAAASARIGDARDTLDSGLISACNPSAEALGLKIGMSVGAAVALLIQPQPETL